MKKIKVMTIFGTRPEAIKMAPLVLELERQPERFESIVTVTAQHRQMLDQVLDIFQIKPDYDLDVMKDRQTLADITANVLIGLESVMKEAKPDIVLVHGDTTTTFAAGISAFYNQIKVGHVEAGLRTWNKYSPFPEEMNRQVTDVLADMYFAPTIESEANLLQENHPADKIFITGNTAIDALQETVKEEYQHEVLTKIASGNRLVLMTMHRRENQGVPMERVFHAIRQVVDKHEDVEVVYPVHLNPVVQEAADRILGNHPRIHLIAPLDVIDFHNLASRSYMIMSDSGGVQEEAPSLGVPVLVLRDTTERPEGVAAGTLRLVGTETDAVLEAMTELLEDPSAHQKMAEASNPYGDGLASKRILDAIAYEFGLSTEKPASFQVK
ncbi:MAG: UDP-N-acetylglucosamine 2-epimerase (non-hydrolyzing) [Carnobacterium sp.]|uniref:UDP-N-acetylglucosamine 2-epimerase (non-hydrolyzing) n=1 Tax=Carnobacterium maltaromaticum LMA28 TaxID=1234679 RepID=K8ETR9_CARML|nr:MULTISPECIES: UDP-N-acetylglucosamine 2-epimerase (non-hydrolyzing) [Carnobacterium]KRN67937.1 UDP-N-acetylmannosamine 2-epimerase [Carnobacterium maltaromaticum DSM 20342]KRN71305.1 UDP-N-acetylmannosamine 2-epimerase [Carnobacterium maltaromaticum]KRN84420.1 UDP-N-acetylmannosamine 2-epimerase [Carnobacterium maltaromaticum]MBC9810597.1 UDP-N-acetylglucosamine 2-epimerase (non-hydrolyzing) [Carnobacterium maltaromaticum]MBQ6485476.1 UDP-N-acetylglucosamine 2-epimerase (non-hydrolyzing) [C